MRGDPFGNLQDWGGVLDALRREVEAGKVDEVQPGLVRLIRYRQNWRVREQALLAAARVEKPAPALLVALLEVVADAGTYVDARILAARALSAVVPRAASAGLPHELDPDTVSRVLREQLAVPEAPVLHQALERAIVQITERTPWVSA